MVDIGVVVVCRTWMILGELSVKKGDVGLSSLCIFEFIFKILLCIQQLLSIDYPMRADYLSMRALLCQHCCGLFISSSCCVLSDCYICERWMPGCGKRWVSVYSVVILLKIAVFVLWLGVRWLWFGRVCEVEFLLINSGQGGYIGLKLKSNIVLH